MTLAPGTKLGPYELLSPIGAGGMGEVYRARDPRVGRDVAIKVSSEQFSDRFTREIHAVAALNHSNICTLYDVGPNYLVMELVDGPTLADRIKQGPISLEESLEIARQIADALEAAHEKGIVHRDLKPGNIKIRPDGTVKVLDFGLAKVEETAAVSLETSPTLSVAQTAAGVLLGTAAYMSPEQARGKPVDKRADIWAFGVVLYEMLTGKQLFSGETVSDTLATVLKEEPDWDKVPEKARLLLRRCLEKDPKKRLRDIGDAFGLIKSVPESTATSARRSLLAWGMAALLFLALLVLSILYFRQKPPASAGQARFQISFPDKVSPPVAGDFVVSPDGRQLVFTGVSSDGVKRLWLRAIDSLEARPLPGTEINNDASLPFWSPDSRFIAFGAGGKLKKIDVSGGPPQTITDISGNVPGGSWNSDGVIVFPDYDASNGIVRVSASGGTATPVTKPNLVRKDICHLMPTFLSDGRHFLYFCSTDIPENTGIYVGSLDSKPEEQSPKQLMATPWAASYVPPGDSGSGQLLFLRDQALMTQPFDDRQLRLTGDPTLIADRIGYYLNYGFFSASTNGILIFRNSGSQFSQPTLYDSQGKVLSRESQKGTFGGVALSPDGTRAAIAWKSSPHPSLMQPDIWLLDFARNTNMRFTFAQTWNVNPIWSPDGSRIIFASSRDGNVFNIYQKPASGVKNEELLLKSGEDKYPTSWSSDGRFLLYTARDPKTRGDIWILPIESSGKATPLLRTEFNECYGRFSPDMRYVAYQSDESGGNEIYVRGFSQASGGASLETGGKWMISRGGGTEPRWRGDGKVLYYRSADGKIMAVEVKSGTVFQTGTPKLLFQPLADVSTAAAWSDFNKWDITADGNRFFLPTSVQEESASAFTVILNWTSLLKK